MRIYFSTPSVKAPDFLSRWAFMRLRVWREASFSWKTGRDGFARYVKGLAPYAGGEPGAAVVMNANPFTRGHGELLRRAAQENARVVLFVLSEDRSLVPCRDRLAMVKAAAAQYPHVSVVLSGSYMISSATFPSYFLKDADHRHPRACAVGCDALYANRRCAQPETAGMWARSPFPMRQACITRRSPPFCRKGAWS